MALTLGNAFSSAIFAFLADAGDRRKLALKARLAAQRTVVGNAETVGLVAHALQQVQSAAALVQHHRGFRVRQIQLLVAFGKAEHRQIHPAGKHRAAREDQLLGPAVDQNHVREMRETAFVQGLSRLVSLRALRKPVGKAAAQHLFHGSEVVCAFHGLDAEMPVLLFVGHAQFKHHHRADGKVALGVGDIVAFDAAGQRGQMERVHQLLQGQHRAPVFDLLALLVF